ncbi:signal peptidase I [Paenibacillus mucilaginosus]|uniref:Signal peptidase I n=3 Tax=Paenibacillus mucilaginosus TaxID=61624 RepID=H6NQ78_9BACL|nr:signal peptidase I [Paenibacillus mucilaginosus]AEI44364.1 signal peptidase I [Paenibacillus mucilaginosus KNP414]AFC31902.1 signal peptidase I [Paenibacillus mucilaginosus 3016]AFH64259.1 signal peptidase I [Paenibacillus mucilaginosus K02]MCG7213745.1 signal peptidase I [Paenibacillus mucilaginosus]WDM25759.1 signal peptidase I [Paenibacillus mucilaginosus]
MEQDQTVDKSTPVKNEAWEWIKALLIAAALVFFIRWLVFAPFIVEGPSMQPNFETGERLIVNKFIYRFTDPKHGEVLVFHAPSEKDYIKRVIALPGETVRVEGDQVYVNNQLVDETYLKEALDKAKQEGRPYNMRNFPEQTVPEGSVFVMGDNRSNSSDSRDPSVGFVPYEKIVGRADLIFWPFDKISLVHSK